MLLTFENLYNYYMSLALIADRFTCLILFLIEEKNIVVEREARPVIRKRLSHAYFTYHV